MTQEVMTPNEMRTPKQIELDLLVKKRVQAGIALLEREFGPQWVDEVERRGLTRGFDIKSAQSCVLGLVYGDYHEGKERLELVSEEAISFGFYTSDDDEAIQLLPEDQQNSWAPHNLIYEALQDVWCQEFKQRDLKLDGCGD